MGKLELIMETEKVSMYSPKFDGEANNEFEKFLLANRSQTHPQLKKFFDAILSVIEKMGRRVRMNVIFDQKVETLRRFPHI